MTAIEPASSMKTEFKGKSGFDQNHIEQAVVQPGRELSSYPCQKYGVSYGSDQINNRFLLSGHQLTVQPVGL
jgi:hypothetical protein